MVNDRWEIGHRDFITAKYHQNYLEKIPSYKWEFCRGLGHFFGYNKIESEKHIISDEKLIYIFFEYVYFIFTFNFTYIFSNTKKIVL